MWNMNSPLPISRGEGGYQQEQGLPAVYGCDADAAIPRDTARAGPDDPTIDDAGEARAARNIVETWRGGCGGGGLAGGDRHPLHCVLGHVTGSQGRGGYDDRPPCIRCAPWAVGGCACRHCFSCSAQGSTPA